MPQKGPAMFQLSAHNGSRFLKALGILTLIGALLIVGRIVLKVFNEDKGEPEDSHDGI